MFDLLHLSVHVESLVLAVHVIVRSDSLCAAARVPLLAEQPHARQSFFTLHMTTCASNCRILCAHMLHSAAQVHSAFKDWDGQNRQLAR